MDLKREFEKYGFEKILDYIYRNPHKNLPLIMDFIDYMSQGTFPEHRKLARQAIEKEDDPYHYYIDHIIKDVDPELAKHLMANLTVNAGINGSQKRNLLKRQYHYPVPWVMSLLYSDLETMDDLVRQGEALAIYIYLIEDLPLAHQEDFITLTHNHPQSVFLLFTDGQLVNEQMIKSTLRTRNIIYTLTKPNIEKMAFLKERRMLYGMDVPSFTKDLLDEYRTMGIYFLWYHSPSLEHFRLLSKYRINEPLFIIDEDFDIDLLENPHGNIQTYIENGRIEYMKKRSQKKPTSL